MHLERIVTSSSRVFDLSTCVKNRTTVNGHVRFGPESCRTVVPNPEKLAKSRKIKFLFRKVKVLSYLDW